MVVDVSVSLTSHKFAACWSSVWSEIQFEVPPDICFVIVVQAEGSGVTVVPEEHFLFVQVKLSIHSYNPLSQVSPELLFETE